MRYCVYEYYESAEAIKWNRPYYVGQGVTTTRPYQSHRITKTLERKLKDVPHRFSEKLKEVIKSGDITPKDSSLIKVVKKDLTKMEALIEESRLIRYYGRLTSLLPNSDSLLVNCQSGFDKYLMHMVRYQPEYFIKLNEAWENALQSGKTYKVTTYEESKQLLKEFGSLDENKTIKEFEKKNQYKNRKSSNKGLNKKLTETIKLAKKLKVFTPHHVNLMEELVSIIEGDET